MDKFTRRALFVLLALAALGFAAFRYAHYRYHVTDIPFRCLWENEVRMTVDFRSDRTAVVRLPDDRPELYSYRVLAPEVWIEKYQAETGATATLDEWMRDMSHVIELHFSDDPNGTWSGPTFFFRADDDMLYGPPFFGVFYRVSEGPPGGPNSKVAGLWSRSIITECSVCTGTDPTANVNRLVGADPSA